MLRSLSAIQSVLLFFGVWSIDLMINVFNKERPAFIPIIHLDELIPFVPWFIYFYSIYFLLVVAPLILLRGVSLKHYISASIVVMIISYAIFLLFPTKLIRVHPDINSTAGRLTLLYHWLVAPYNLLPSLHLSMLLLAFLSFALYNRPVAVGLAAPIVMSMASVVLTKQHYILDVITAFPLALVAFAITKNDRS